MDDRLEITYTDDGKGKSHSHAARVDFDMFCLGGDFEAYGDTRAEADSELRTKLVSLRSAVDDLLKSPRPDEEPELGDSMFADYPEPVPAEFYVVGESALRGKAMFVDFSGKLVLAHGVYTGELKLYVAAEDLIPDERVVVRGRRIYRHV